MASPADMATRLNASKPGSRRTGVSPELNDRIAAFIQAHAAGRQAAADSG